MIAGVSALPPSSSSGHNSFTRRAPITSKGTPMVLAVPQYFWYSSMRSRQVARRRLPLTWKLTSWPVSAGRRLYRSTEYLWSWPTV